MTHKFKVGDMVVRTADSYTCTDGVKVIKGDKYEVLATFGGFGGIATCQKQVDEGHGWFADGFDLAPAVKPKLDLTKPLQTVDGRPVTLITTEGRGEYPVVGYIGDDSAPVTWTLDGIYYTGDDSPQDLVNVQEELVVYVNVYSDFNAVHGTYQAAYDASHTNGKPDGRLLARKRVVIAVGEFDE